MWFGGLRRPLNVLGRPTSVNWSHRCQKWVQRPLKPMKIHITYSKNPGNDLSHVFMFKKSSWGRSGGLRFWECPTLVPNYHNTEQTWMISEGMRSISQRVGTPTIKCVKWNDSVVINLVSDQIVDLLCVLFWNIFLLSCSSYSLVL